MARTAAERRAARKRKEQVRERRRSVRDDGGAAGGFPGSLLHRLVSAGARAADDEERGRIAVELAALDPGVDREGFVADLFLGVLERLWEHGWQPADVAHVVRRLGTQRLVRLAVAAIVEDARRAGAATRAPEEWQAQLAALGAPGGPGGPGGSGGSGGPGPAFVAAWSRAEGLPAVEAWRDVVLLLGRLLALPVLDPLAPPPSRWGSRPSRPTRSTGSVDARVLGRIRGLLAKAESTEYPEEADALTAKAQELMTRHAVDVAVLDAAQGSSLADQVTVRRVHVDNPYPDAKVRLLNSVATANDVRTVWLESLGMVTAVGLPIDLDSVELLFTSLLVQATRAVTDTGRAGSSRTRSAAFRRSFLTSYAVRIGERLAQAREQATEEAGRSHGAELVPVLRARREAVDGVFAELFPETYSVGTRASDAYGWHAGRLAAENADLGSGRDQVTR